MSKRIFLIPGMHRCGTSSLTQTLGIMGLELPGSIQPGAPDNPKGHFESFNISQYHDALLKELGLSWDTFIAPPDSWFASEYAEKSVQELVEKIQSEFPGNGPIVLKDPRISLFMPLWQKVTNHLDLQEFYIIPLRHPLGVAGSLDRRNKIGQSRSFLIWLNYLFNAEKNSRGYKRTFVHFPDWGKEIESTLEKIESDLGTGFPKKTRKNITRATKEFEQAFIHFQEPEKEQAKNEIEDIAYKVFRSFLKLTKNPADSKALAEIDRLRTQFDKMADVFAEIYFEYELKKETELEQQLAARQEEIEQSQSQAAALQAQLDTSESQRAELEQQLAARQEEIEQSRSQAAALQAQLDTSESQRAELEQQLAARQGEIEQSQSQAAAVQAQLDASESQRAELEQQLAASRSETEQSNTQAAAIQTQFEATEAQRTELEQQLATSRSETEQSIAHADALQAQLDASESQRIELEHQLQNEQDSTSKLQKEINEVKILNLSLSKEYEQLLQTYNKEQLTVLRPLYRNLYKNTGLILRKALPSIVVESIKSFVPNPNGVPKQLTYQPQISKTMVATSEEFLPRTHEAEPDVFVLSIINWDFRVQRPQHIAKGLADSGNRVFYVEMELSDKGPQLIKVADNLYRARLSSTNTGHIQPYTGQPDAEQIKAWLNAFYELCDTVKASSFKQVIIQHPFWWQLARHLSPEYQLIFDCMDDISGFSNTEQFLLDLEHDMLNKCDTLVVSSQHLFDKYKHFKEPVLVRNAAELTHFDMMRKVKNQKSFLKKQVASNETAGKIQVGYVGAIAEWFDVELVREVAASDPDVEFHLCGAVTTKEAAQLEEIPNINMYGEVSYTDVPDFLHEMDVLTIPFKLVPIIQACDPVKFYEYSAMGKPTVTTALPELARASEFTFVASTPQEFSDQIHNAAKAGKKKGFRSKLQEYAAQNTWTHRTSQFKEILYHSPKVSVVILAYGDPELTNAVLHSLFDNGPAYPNMEVLIVDNGSPAGSLKQIHQFAKNYSNVRVIENGENLGFAKGNNVGLQAASGDYVMLLNNDTVVAPGAIYAMVRHLQQNPAVGVVGPLTNNIGNEAKLFVEYENMEQMKDIARQVTTGYRGMFTPINVVAYFAVMFRREDLKVFGLLSEDYGRGMFEDDDHCAMIKSKGYLCALAEDAYIHHHLSATFSKLKDGEKEALFEKNKNTFEKKWGEWEPHKYREERPSSSFISKD